MKPASQARLAALLTAAVGLVPAPAALAAPPPIPQPAGELAGLQPFTGHKAKPHRVRAPRVPRHPFMAANGRNAVHNDAYQTDTYRNLGPLGGAGMRLFSQSIDGAGGI